MRSHDLLTGALLLLPVLFLVWGMIAVLKDMATLPQ